MGKEHTNEAFAARSDKAEESNLRAQDVARDVPPNASRSKEHFIESHLATWHSSNGSRRGGNVRSLEFASHGSQWLEKIYRFPQIIDHWIDAWIEQCDFGVAPQVPESPLNIYEERISCDETDAPYASESRSPGYAQANLDTSSNDEFVPLDSLNGTSNMMERLLAKRVPYPTRPNLQPARGPNTSSSVASVTYANDAYPNATSGYVSAADSGHYSSAASLAGSWASSAWSYISLAGFHAFHAGSQ